MTTVAEHIIAALADHGVTQVWGVVGDALNSLTDAIRREDRIEWIGVRHEEAAAFAVSAQAQLTGTIGVCMGTVGPGSVHLLNGLYDAKKSHAPVLAVTGQVPSEDIGSDYFQEVDNDRLFADVAVWARTLTSEDQLPHLLEQAVNAAYAEGGVAVLTMPGDVGMLELDAPAPQFAASSGPTLAPAEAIEAASAALAKARKVTLLVGTGARGARDQVLELAGRLKATMVLTIKAKSAFDDDNPFEVGQAGLLGNPAAAGALKDCDTLVMIGTDFPYRDFYPQDATVIQLDVRGPHIGRRTHVNVPVVGDARASLIELLRDVDAREDSRHLDAARDAYAAWQERQRAVSDPDYEKTGLVAKVRSVFDNPDDRIRPEALAAAVDAVAPSNAIFTVDTGMSTTWTARFIRMRGARELVGSFNLGSMANALPQALGAQALDRGRCVVSMSGDGGVQMLLGDLRTAVIHELPVKVVVFNNGTLGMVRLEQEQGGLPTFGTDLDNPDLAAVASALGLQSRRIDTPGQIAPALEWLFAQPGPALLDVVTNPDEIAVPPRPTVGEAWGFAVAKLTESLESRR